MHEKVGQEDVYYSFGKQTYEVLLVLKTYGRSYAYGSLLLSKILPLLSCSCCNAFDAWYFTCLLASWALVDSRHSSLRFLRLVVDTAEPHCDS